MMVTVTLFGLVRLDSGVKQLELEAATVRELYPKLLVELSRRSPDSSLALKDLKACAVAVNECPAKPGTKLRDGDIVYLIPPIAGG